MESTVLGSRYELLERVGMGGMAVVYKAKDIMLNRFVAIKILREEYKENEDFIRRFKIEAQAAASLSHQNIAQIYDVGEEKGMNYIVMEFLEGETLKKYILSKQGNLSRREAMNYSMQICRALEHAHSKYVVHRDIKPQNIVLTESGKLKLADFGIARAANNTTTVNSKSNMAVGSAHYLSPEQARGGYTDHRSDIYSFGVVMYEMFCGKLPFDAEESVSVILQHLHEEPVRPCEVNPDLPLGIEAIILRAMKKEQRLRYDNTTQILEDLVAVYQNPSIDVSLLNASSVTGEEKQGSEVAHKPQPKTHVTPQRNTQSRKKKKKKKISGGIIAILVLLAVAVITASIVVANFLFPDTGKEVEVPDLVGMTFDEAVREAGRASTGKVTFTVTIAKYDYDDNAPKDTIISQTPAGGGKVKRSREIKVVVSKGPVVVTLKDYSGQNFQSIKKELESLGVIVEYEEQESNGPEGEILDQNPSKGTKLGEGETVTFYVSVSPISTRVPDFVGMESTDAINEINHSDLILLDVIDDETSTLPAGIVCRQTPEANDTVYVGTYITLYVSTGKNYNPDSEGLVLE